MDLIDSMDWIALNDKGITTMSPTTPIQKIGIIYPYNYSYSMIVADILQEYLANFFNLTVGLISTMDPSIMVDEQVNTLIVGDTITNDLPTPELLSWLKELALLCSREDKQLKIIGRYSIGNISYTYEEAWHRFFQEHLNILPIQSSLLHIEVNTSQNALEKHSIGKIKQFIGSIISYLLL